jgi:hypothetical protein
MEDRAEAMAADGRRVGRVHGKRYVEALAVPGALEALKRAIEAEGTSSCPDAWGDGYVEGLRDTLAELEGRSSLSRLDRD